MSSKVLSDLASALTSGAVKVVDLTAPLGPETPVICRISGADLRAFRT